MLLSLDEKTCVLAGSSNIQIFSIVFVGLEEFGLVSPRFQRKFALKQKKRRARIFETPFDLVGPRRPTLFIDAVESKFMSRRMNNSGKVYDFQQFINRGN